MTYFEPYDDSSGAVSAIDNMLVRRREIVRHRYAIQTPWRRALVELGPKAPEKLLKRLQH